MGHFKITEEEYRRLRYKKASIEKKLIKATGSFERRYRADLREITDNITASEKLFPQWKENFATHKQKKVELTYPDLQVNGISELFKKFREIFILLVPDHTRKTFTRVMTDYVHQNINVNKCETFIKERERFTRYIKTRFKLN